MNDCPAGTAYQCLGANWGGSTGIRRGSDLALLRLATAAPTWASPVPVVTSLADDVFEPGAAWTHRRFDDSPEFADRNTIPLPTIVGFGTPSCNGVVRRSGLAQFEGLGEAWHKGCSETYSCQGPSPTTTIGGCYYTRMDGTVVGSPTWYHTDSVRVGRTFSPTLFWNGPIASNGDSGGPLFVDFPDGQGVARRYLVGALSGGYQAGSACGLEAPPGYLSNEYGAPFTPENGLWIEKSLQYWASSEYTSRVNGWLPTAESLGGVLGSGPGASSSGVPNDVDSYVLGSTGQVWRNHWNGVSWQWSGPLSSETMTSAPAAASWGGSRSDVIVRGPAGQAIHLWTNDGYVWSQESLGGAILGGTAPTVVTWGPDSLLVFVVGTDGALWKNEYSAAAGWGGFSSLSAYMSNMTSSPSAVAWAPGRVDVFAQRADGKVVGVYEERFAAPQLGWQFGARTFFPYDVAPNQGVSAVSWAPGRIDVFGRYAPNTSQLIQFSRQSQGWMAGSSALHSFGGLGGTPAAASWGPGRLDLFAQGAAPGYNLLHKYFPL